MCKYKVNSFYYFYNQTYYKSSETTNVQLVTKIAIQQQAILLSKMVDT